MRTNASKKIKLIAILCLLSNLSLTGQVADCAESKIVGEWKYIRSYSVDSNIDSLKNTLSDSNEVRAVWSFKPDGTYTYQSKINNISSKGHYRLVGNSCKMKFGRMGTPRTIFFLNDKYMLILHPNPHLDSIDFLSRN